MRIHGEVLQLHWALSRDGQSSARQYYTALVHCCIGALFAQLILLHFIIELFIPLFKHYTWYYYNLHI